MVNSILISWHALVTYFQRTKGAVEKGFEIFLTNIENFKLMAVEKSH